MDLLWRRALFFCSGPMFQPEHGPVGGDRDNTDSTRPGCVSSPGAAGHPGDPALGPIPWAGLRAALLHFVKVHSLNHLVGAGKQRRRHIEAERFSCLQVDDEFELGRLKDRQIGGLLPFKDAAR